MLRCESLCSCSYLDKIHIEKTEGFDFLKALTLNVDILEDVLSYLQYTDLQNCSKLNDVWANRVEAVLRKRLAPNIFTLPLIYCDDSELSSKPGLCFLFLSNNELEEYNDRPLKLNTYLNTPPCKHRNIEVKRKPVIEIVENDILAQTKCPLITLNCRSIYASFDSEVPVRASGIIFPQIPNVKFSVFRIKKSQLGKFDRVVDQYIGDDHKLECLLSFGVYPRKIVLTSFIKYLKNSRPTENFAFGGGFVLGKQAFNYLSKRTSSEAVHQRDEMLCATFSTPKNVDAAFNAYSFIIPFNFDSQQDIESSLLELKKNCITRKYGVVFQITCVSRDPNEIPMTTGVLTKLFHNVEVVGFTGDGEIGWNYFPKKETDSEPDEKRSKKQMKLFHELTTIIVLITWGKVQTI